MMPANRTALTLFAIAIASVLAVALVRPAQADAVRVDATTRGNSARLTLVWPAPIAVEATSANGNFVLQFDRPAQADFGAAAAKLRRFLDHPQRSDRGRTLSFPLRPGVVALTLADGRRVIVDLIASDEAIATDADTAKTQKEAIDGLAAAAVMRPVPAPNRRSRANPTSTTATSVGLTTSAGSAEVVESGGATTASATLRFDWTEPVAAAIFHRAGILWMVFDRPSIQDIASLRQAAGAAARMVEQRPHPRATVLRFELAAKLTPVISRDALAWIVTLAQDPPPSPIVVTPIPRENAAGHRDLVLPIAEPGAPLALTDPWIGDNLVVVPTIPIGAGLRHAYAYPQVRLLPSSQGFVIRPLVDDLRIRVGREAVEIGSTAGLAVTPIENAVAARARLRDLAGGAHPSGLTSANTVPLSRFTPVRQDLEAAIAAAKTADARERLRLRLARHYLSHGFAAEALAALQLADRDRAAFATEPGFLILRGIAHALLGRDAEAARDLDRPVLATSVEAATWRTALNAGAKQANPEETALAAQAAVAAGYPKGLRRYLLPRLAEVAIDAGAASLAAKLVGLVTAEAEGPGDAAQAGFLEGHMLAANGNVAGALEAWRAAAEGPDPWRRSRVRAADAGVRLALAKTQISVDEAIESLDSLSFAWRGDCLEFSILERLGTLYLDRGDQTAALRILRRATTILPEAAREANIPARMSHAFAALFVGADAERRSPLEAIALYDEFRELTPNGPLGDSVVAAVAERMIALDLLGRAAALLDSQIRYRLVGEERARTAMRLAAIYLLDEKPEAALKALALTATDPVPPALAPERRMIEARALARLGRTDEALARLAGLETAAAAAIRADIYWAMKDWHRAAGALSRVLKIQSGDSHGDGAPAPAGAGAATDTDADSTMHLAVALALAGEEADLVQLGANSGERMASSRWGDVFPLITSRTIAEADLRALTRNLAPVDRFRAFLANDTTTP